MKELETGCFARDICLARKNKVQCYEYARLCPNYEDEIRKKEMRDRAVQKMRNY